MKVFNCRFLILVFSLMLCTNLVHAQKSKKSTKRTTKAKTKTNVQASAATADTTVNVTAPAAPVANTTAKAPVLANDSIPLKVVKKSLRLDAAVDNTLQSEKTPLAYENLRYDDAFYRQKLMLELDCREKINHSFMYKVDEDNGNQQFISILLKAISDSAVTAFSDERFTTPMTKSEVAKMAAGEEVEVKHYNDRGEIDSIYKKRNDINLDSFYRFHIKEEVVFDKESSRLFWRVIGIAPVKNVITSGGVDLGPSELFWVYYPDMRPVFAKYEVYNGKNFANRMTWDELFESRMFSGKIIKTSYENPKGDLIANYPGYKENPLFQLFESEQVKERIHDYEQDVWAY